jgi:membrane-bound metal-dependent hydrolase YbcI (DUF457 family)
MLPLALWGRLRMRKAIAYGFAFMSHGLLDYVTTKEGGGVKLLWPFSNERLGLRLWGLSEIPSKLPPVEIIEAVLLEFIIFTPLLLAVLLMRRCVGGR